MYAWRNLTPEQKQELLNERKFAKRPWHHPPHFIGDGNQPYLFTAACYEHHPVIGHSQERLARFSAELVGVFDKLELPVRAWVVLPNHYHVLADTSLPGEVLSLLGQLHGRTSHAWNGEEGTRGRKVWHGAVETVMKSEAHLRATINYVHHNPVKHGLVLRWQDWPYGNAREYLDDVGEIEAKRIWKAYPVDDYGKTWDP